MSSKDVRDSIKTFIGTDIPTETVFDLTNLYDEIDKDLQKAGINYNDSWLGIQFIGSEESPITVLSTNTTGKYREEGAIFLHVVSPAKASATDDILNRTETIRNAFRGKRIGDILILSVAPPNFEAAATMQFESGWTSASIIVNYRRDLNL